MCFCLLKIGRASVKHIHVPILNWIAFLKFKIFKKNNEFAHLVSLLNNDSVENCVTYGLLIWCILIMRHIFWLWIMCVHGKVQAINLNFYLFSCHCLHHSLTHKTIITSLHSSRRQCFTFDFCWMFSATEWCDHTAHIIQINKSQPQIASIWN